ncbi:MAG TPA: recombinase family protein [Planctomycetaceae bacterium]|jgi:DNA invertase Pin-like site-specific DNA recombinase
MIPIVLYLRMSDPRQDTSIDNQRDVVAARAKKQGYKILREYVEPGISGDDTKKRLQFQKMIADSARGDFKGILCRNQDRFGRFDPLEAGYWIQPLRERGIWLETVDDGRIEWGTFMGRLGYVVKQEGKKAFLVDLSKNALHGMYRAAMKGLPQAAPPTGYVLQPRHQVAPGELRGVLIDDHWAEVVRKIYALYLSGLSCGQVARKLNELGIKPRKAEIWTRTTIHQALTNEFYTGTFLWNSHSQGRYYQVSGAGSLVEASTPGKIRKKPVEDVVRIEKHHPAIVDLAMWRKAQKLLRENQRVTAPRIGGREFAFSSLLRCGSCEAPLHGRWYGRRTDSAYYVCSRALHSAGCRLSAVPETELRAMVFGAIADHFCSRENIAAMLAALKERTAQARSRGNLASLQRQHQAVSAKLKKSKTRLLELDRDMLPLVQEQIRELIAEEERLQEAIDDARAPAEAIAESELIGIGRSAKELITDSSTPPGDLRRALRKILGPRRPDDAQAGLITVHTSPAPASSYPRRSSLEGVEFDVSVGAHLTTAAGP